MVKVSTHLTAPYRFEVGQFLASGQMRVPGHQDIRVSPRDKYKLQN
jgi:hypothetical protein